MYAEDITPESLRQLAQNKQGQLAQKLDEARTRERDAVLRADEEVRALYQ